MTEPINLHLPAELLHEIEEYAAGREWSIDTALRVMVSQFLEADYRDRTGREAYDAETHLR